MTKKIIKWKKEKNIDSYDDEYLVVVFVIFGAIVLISLGIGLIIGNTLGIIQNILLPEVTILDYIKTMT